MSDEEEEDQIKKKGNALPLWGNQQTMNVNNLIVTNILSSPYFKNELIKLKTFHEVIDEIYYKVDHLEPWEKGSRKLHGQVGMCGGVRGVGTGGIVSSTFCLLFKLFTLKLTKKQVHVLVNHSDSAYIRALGLMFIRYCQHPNSFWQWFEPYLEDDEEIDPKAGGGCKMTIGQMVRSFILKLDWYGTLFPRIPVPIHKELEANLKAINLNDDRKVYADEEEKTPDVQEEPKKPRDNLSFGEAERYAKKKRDERKHSPSHSDGERRRHSPERERHRSPEKEHRHRSDEDRHTSSKKRSSHRDDYDIDRSKHENGHKSKHRSHDRPRDGAHERPRHRSRSKDRKRSKSRERKRSRSKDKKRSGSKDRKRGTSRDGVRR